MGTVYKRGNTWTMDYKDQNGNDRQKAIGKVGVITKTMAREILRKKEQQVKLGQYDMLDADIPTLDDFTKQYIAYKRDTEKKPSWKSDEQHLRLHLIPFFGRNRKLSDIKPQDIDDYKSSRLKENAAPATVDRELAVLRHLINLAERWNKFFGKNPVSIAGLLHFTKKSHFYPLLYFIKVKLVYKTSHNQTRINKLLVFYFGAQLEYSLSFSNRINNSLSSFLSSLC